MTETKEDAAHWHYLAEVFKVPLNFATVLTFLRRAWTVS